MCTHTCTLPNICTLVHSHIHACSYRHAHLGLHHSRTHAIMHTHTCTRAPAYTRMHRRGRTHVYTGMLTPICTCTLTRIQYTHRRAHTLTPICVHTLYAHIHIHTAQCACTGAQGSVHTPEHRAEWQEVMEKLTESGGRGTARGSGVFAPMFHPISPPLPPPWPGSCNQ